jgi:hypothetical protein
VNDLAKNIAKDYYTFASQPRIQNRADTCMINSYKIINKIDKKDTRKHTFSHGVVDLWNTLNPEVVYRSYIIEFIQGKIE